MWFGSFWSGTAMIWRFSISLTFTANHYLYDLAFVIILQELIFRFGTTTTWTVGTHTKSVLKAVNLRNARSRSGLWSVTRFPCSQTPKMTSKNSKLSSTISSTLIHASHCLAEMVVWFALVFLGATPNAMIQNSLRNFWSIEGLPKLMQESRTDRLNSYRKKLNINSELLNDWMSEYLNVL